MKPRALAPAALGVGLLLAPAAGALPVLSEVLYDASGADDGLVFVELYGAPFASVEGLVLEGVNGADGDVTVSITLSGSLPEDGVLVVADRDAGGATAVAEADLLADFDFQNAYQTPATSTA